MFVLITYDVNITSPQGPKRLRTVARSCLNFGKRVQNSVFECVVTEAQYVKLKADLLSKIDIEHDSVRFYILGNNWKHRVDVIGKDNGIDFTGNLII